MTNVPQKEKKKRFQEEKGAECHAPVAILSLYEESCAPVPAMQWGRGVLMLSTMNVVMGTMLPGALLFLL